MPIARFIGVALQRLNYPFELEWIEGGSVGHIQVAMSGHQLYREPSFDFTPFIYPPLYYYVSALPSYVLGLGLLAPRLVSFASILGCFALLARWVRDETGDTAAGFAAAGLLAAVYQLTGLWMDLARVDSLFLFITLSANVLARSTHTVRRAALVGALLTASCFTKQLGIPLALPALVFLTLRSFRLGVVATLSAGATAALGALVFGLSSHGWIFYYLFQLPAHHEVEWSRLLPSMQTYFLGVTLPLTVAGLALLCGFGFPGKNWKEWIYSALFVFVGVTSSYLPYLKSGGYVNGLIPAYAALSLAAGIQLGNLRRRKREPTAMLGVVGPAVFTALLLAYQCAALAYDPNAALPTPADLAANEQALQRMKKLPQPLFVTASAHWNRISQEHGVP
ncbi:MAG: glycosyltransferase family 39 protein, partial [Polyangiaceae bacterium]